MKEVTKGDLFNLLDKSQYSELAVKYSAWLKLESNDETNLVQIGTVSVDQEYNEEYPTKENYWSPKYPIALEYYPYFGCDIYSDGKSYFLIYQENGGHASIKRCRVVKKELLV
jgi:hypothetical protein